MNTLENADAPQSEYSPLCRAMRALLEYEDWATYNGDCYVDTPENLLARLKKHGGEAAEERGFPANAKRLGIELNREKPALQKMGVMIAFKRGHSFSGVEHRISRLWLIGTVNTYADEAALLAEIDEKAQRRRILGY